MSGKYVRGKWTEDGKRSPAIGSSAPIATMQPPKAPEPVREEIYRLRNALLLKTARLELADLRRVVELLDALTDRDAQRVAAFASALAEWTDPDAF
jgi:hypothetical protein